MWWRGAAYAGRAVLPVLAVLAVLAAKYAASPTLAVRLDSHLGDHCNLGEKGAHGEWQDCLWQGVGAGMEDVLCRAISRAALAAVILRWAVGHSFRGIRCHCGAFRGVSVVRGTRIGGNIGPDTYSRMSSSSLKVHSGRSGVAGRVPAWPAEEGRRPRVCVRAHSKF